jgi:hypothetical protein
MLYGTPDRADEIRTQMVAHLVANRPRFENHLVLNPLTLGGLNDLSLDAVSWCAYIAKVSTPKEWLGHLLPCLRYRKFMT